MKKAISSAIMLVFTFISIIGQTTNDTTRNFLYPTKENIEKPYYPEENAEEKLNELMQLAKKERKNIFIQAGGNWCGWCLRFNYFVHNVPELKSILKTNYLYYHLNYSPENKNEAVFAKYTEKGKRYGYPFFIILSCDGDLLHIQESGILEAGQGYDTEKVKVFLETWIPRKK